MGHEYIRVNTPNGRRYEHRVVMERVLGRPLRRDEHVHHINENPRDNRPENLRVVSPSEHRHLHPEGKARWNSAGRAAMRAKRGDRWARDYDACVRCKRTDSKHNGRGICGRCHGETYIVRWRAAHPDYDRNRWTKLASDPVARTAYNAAVCRYRQQRRATHSSHPGSCCD